MSIGAGGRAGAIGGRAIDGGEIDGAAIDGAVVTPAWAAGWAAALDVELPAAVGLRRELHRAPELSGHEDRTADRVVAAVASAADRHPAAEPGSAVPTVPVLVSSVAGTGRLVRIGPPTGPAVAVRAELDALPLTEQTGSAWASETPGVMHACGHDVHLAAAVALGRAAAAAHRVTPLPAALLLVLQPREELAPSGARDVVASGALAEHGVTAVLGVHLQPQVAAGRLAVDPGVVNAGVDEFTITITGRGGHSAYPHLAVDPVPALCQSVLAVRDAGTVVDPMRPTVVTVGMLRAGTAPNVIGGTAVAEGTIRTFDVADRDRIFERMRAAVAGTAAAFGCSGELTVRHGEPALRNDPELVAAIRSRLGDGPPAPAAEFRSCGSDDFAAYGEVLPSVMMFLGVADGSPMLHDSRFLPPDRLVGEVASALLAGCLGAIGRGDGLR